MFCLLSVFCVFCCLHITEYEQIRRGGHFLGPRGVKYLNTGLATASRTIPCIFRCVVYIRCAVSTKKVRENGKYWVRVIHKVRVINGKIRYLAVFLFIYSLLIISKGQSMQNFVTANIVS
jgi:hypothetical protein